MSKDIDSDEPSRPVSDHESQSQEPAGPTRESWTELPSNPDLETDFGYDLREWECFDAPEDTDKLMFIPDSADAIKNDTFVVAEADDVRDLSNFC